MKDIRGIDRGACQDCVGEDPCPEYIRDKSGPRCGWCDCVPLRHERKTNEEMIEKKINDWEKEFEVCIWKKQSHLFLWPVGQVGLFRSHVQFRSTAVG